MIDDPYIDVTDCLDWVVQPPDEIMASINGTLDADAGLCEEFD